MKTLFLPLIFAPLALLPLAPLRAQDNTDTGIVSLVGKIEWPGTSVVDLWGYVDEATGREYVLVGRFDPPGLIIVETTDPANPVEVATVPGIRTFDVKVWRHYAYTVTGRSTLRSGERGAIVDLSDPAHPVVVNDRFTSSHNIFIDGRGYLYAAEPGLTIYDLNADPTQPEQVWAGGSYNGGNQSHDAAVIGGRLYDFRGINLPTSIYDVSDPTSPQELGAFSAPFVTMSHSGWPTEDDNFLFVCDENARGDFVPDFTIWDISDPANAEHVGNYNDEDATVHNLYVIGELAFAAYYTAGFRVFDVSDPAAPRIVGQYDTSSHRGESLLGSLGVYAFSPSRHIYATNSQTMLSTQTGARGSLFIFAIEGFTDTGSAIDPAASGRPGVVALEGPYPNPFSTTTTLRYRVGRGGPVELAIYDVLGRRVATLVEATATPGEHAVVWDGRDGGSAPVASGVYLARLQAGEAVQSRVMSLVK